MVRKMRKKNIIITGASKGIGLSLARGLADISEHLILTASSQSSFENLDLYKGNNAHTLAADFSDADSISHLSDKVNSLTPIVDVLINNLGIYIEKPFMECTDKEILNSQMINFTGPTLFTQKMLPLLKNGINPLIINIGSAAALSGPKNQGIYAASKAAVSTFSKSLRREVNKDGIRVTVIHPTSVNTWNDPHPKNLLAPDDITSLIDYIVKSPGNCQFEEIVFSSVYTQST